MSNYKIPQDVEAEDKLIGPFTFRQFIFLLIAAAAVFVGWLFTKINGWLVLIPLPIFLFFGFLGIYRREDQPVEIYLLAALNFFLKPRKRIWGPEGIQENVRLVTPPRQEKPRLKTLETEERGQLEKLAHVMDTRGWSTKRPELNESINRESLSLDDRLAVPLSRVTDQEPLDIHSSDDLLDPINYRDAGKYRELAEGSSKEAKQKAIANMKKAVQKKQEAKDSETGRLRYSPYPSAVKQTRLEPDTGTLQRREATTAGNSKPLVNPKITQSEKPHIKLAGDNDLSIKHIARQANRLGGDTSLHAGEEIDLPNRGEQPA